MTGDATSELVILGHLRDPRAVPVLARYTEHPERLARYHAVRGLAWRDDEDAVAAMEQAHTDDELIVRLEAAAGMARREPARARLLYQAIIDDPRVPPLLRAKTAAMLRDLRKGQHGFSGDGPRRQCS
jgi:HEAT repeat protein